VRFRSFFAAAVVPALMLAACAHTGPSACRAPAAAAKDIDATILAFFDGLRRDDRAAFERLTTASFYSFDVGKRFEGSELLDLVRDARARGVQLNWNIGRIDTHLGCDMAWAAWENVGSAGVPPRVQPVRWLESAVLIRQNGIWKIDFFHSTRAATER
jgi:hypothetical protein